MRNVQHARNLYDRAVGILPRIDQLWYKYVHLEELLGNVPGQDRCVERWMFVGNPRRRRGMRTSTSRVRYDEMERASAIWERAVTCHPPPPSSGSDGPSSKRTEATSKRHVWSSRWRWTTSARTRMRWKRPKASLPPFAKMETRLKEYERARVIYKYALERLPRSKSAGIYSSYTRFEKQFGTMSSVEIPSLASGRIQYEEELAAPEGAHDYDTWFRTTLDSKKTPTARSPTRGASQEQLEQAVKRVREVYERAIAQVPSSTEKRDWRRYIFLWLRYALFEELDIHDFSRTREIYKAAIAVVPHRRFTSPSCGSSMPASKCADSTSPPHARSWAPPSASRPKLKLFNSYIDLELSLKEFDRARKIYEKALEWDPTNSQTWVRFAELEKNLFDTDRARALFELGVGQAERAEEGVGGGLDMPEIVWKAYIDFEFGEREWERVDALYERLLEKSGHVKVWISYALSKVNQATAMEEDEDEARKTTRTNKPQPPRELTEEEQQQRHDRRAHLTSLARDIFTRAYASLKSRSLKAERVTLLEAWKTFERQHGARATLEDVEAKMPACGQEEEGGRGWIDGGVLRFDLPRRRGEGQGRVQAVADGACLEGAQAAKEQEKCGGDECGRG